MREVPATEFTRNFGLYREVAQREPVAVTSHGRPTGYFISAVEYEEMQRLKAFARRPRAITDLTEAEIKAVSASRMGPEHNSLDTLLEDE
jgi:prevent-host-death family protein